MFIWGCILSYIHSEIIFYGSSDYVLPLCCSFIDEDEIYLHEVVGAEEIHHPTVQPLSKRLLQNIRDRLYVEWLMDMTIRDIVLYAIYLGVVTFLVHAHRNINLAYRNNLAIEDVVVNPGCINLNKCFFLAKVLL